jgi:hypothetical protein
VPLLLLLLLEARSCRWCGRWWPRLLLLGFAAALLLLLLVPGWGSTAWIAQLDACCCLQCCGRHRGRVRWRWVWPA